MINVSTTVVADLEQGAADFVATFERLRNEVSRFIVGQKEIIEDVLIAILCGGHVLLEGVPGLGKTALVQTVSRALDLKFQRIQFTPDLLPADIVGTQVLIERDGRRQLEFQAGPVFCNVLLADEINRATPKTQSALLETMQEKSVTVARQTHSLDLPFFVLATQNPIEQDGTFPLPEAQLDRFFFKLFVSVPGHAEFSEILNRTGGNVTPHINQVASGEDILRMGRLLREVPIDQPVQDHLIRIVRATHPQDPHAPDSVRKFVRYGASPRAAQSILGAARANALIQGRYHVACEDVNQMAVPALRHRVLLSFEGEAEGISTDEIVAAVLQKLDS
jgi:MoxR-like ATPase